MFTQSTGSQKLPVVPAAATTYLASVNMASLEAGRAAKDLAARVTAQTKLRYSELYHGLPLDDLLMLWARWSLNNIDITMNELKQPDEAFELWFRALFGDLTLEVDAGGKSNWSVTLTRNIDQPLQRLIYQIGSLDPGQLRIWLNIAKYIAELAGKEFDVPSADVVYIHRWAPYIADDFALAQKI